MTMNSAPKSPKAAFQAKGNMDRPYPRPVKPEQDELSPEQQKLALLMEYIGKVIKL